MLKSTAGFLSPVYVSGPEDCFFYHSIDLPQFGLQVGHWDLRKDVDAYLGNQSFANKTVVDVGTASGYLAFEMEARGADVIAFDRSESDIEDDAGLIPYHDFSARFGYSLQEAVQHRIAGLRNLRNSFWLTHRLRNSNVRYYAGNVYAHDIGEVDYAFFGCILLHLRDPIGALSSFARIAREKVIITDTLENLDKIGEAPVMYLRANARDKGNPGTWWYLTPALLKQYLAVLGFSKSSLSFHKAYEVGRSQDAPFFTLVAER
jgi:methyltransferase family protein